MAKKQRQIIPKLTHPQRLIVLTLEDLKRAARLWAEVRRAGMPTADDKTLDADAILAAQVLGLQLPTGQFIVATGNAAHITRFGVPADEWQNITP